MKMAEADDLVELLFFDTFSHEINEDINLDLVQFPKPVYITEVRIIPLGARVQADFPGGVRLGATNPSKFGIEFFVNDLGKPGACTFERLGNLEYNQNDCIHLECQDEKIPTDGLVLRGWYTTITLAVYGTLTKNLAEPIASPPPIEPPPEEVSITPAAVTTAEELTKENKSEWREEVSVPPPLPPQPTAEVFEREIFQESKFDKNFDQSNFNEEGNIFQSSSQDGIRDHEKRSSKRRTPSSERSSSRNRTYSRSDSNEREYISRQKREWSRSPDYRHSRRSRRDRSRELELSEREHKRPRTPPQIDSPRRPRSPANSADFSDIDEDSNSKQKLKGGKLDVQTPKESNSESQTPQRESTDEIQEPQSIEDEGLSQDEPFEPILSDDEIVGDDENDEQENDDLDMDEDFDDAIKIFDPFKMDINRYEVDKVMHPKDCEFTMKILKKYELQTKVEDKEEFLKSTSDEKENFIHISEQIISHLNSFKNRNLILETIFNDDKKNLHLMMNVLKLSLDFECACSQPQPAYKIRHIKTGARMSEILGISEEFINYLVNVGNLDPFRSLLDLYSQDYMALSIKLMILKAIYSLLDTKSGVNIFLHSKLNGYHRLILLLDTTPLTRAKYAIKSIIKKLNLYEALENIRTTVTNNLVLTNQYSNDNYEELEICLKLVKSALCTDALGYQQPKRFLPVAKKFEVIKDIAAERSWNHMLRSYFKTHALVESLLVIVCNQNLVPAVLLDTVFDLIDCLVRSSIGIDYLVEDSFESVQILVKCLLEVDLDNFGENIETDSQQPPKEEEEGEIEEKEKERKEPTRATTRAQKLGVHLAFAIQSRYHLDAITHIKDDPDLLVEHLHALYSQTCYHPGRKHTVEIFSMNSNIVPILSLIEKERKIQAQRQDGSPGVKYKSPVLSYSVDLLDCIVRHCTNLDYLIEHGHVLLELVKNHEIFEPSVSAVLQEMSVYLKPFETIPNFTYDNITPLSDVIKRSIEYITTFPGDLIMSLRILQHLGIENEHVNSECETKELKHRYVLLQFYSSDGVITLLSILEKLNAYFEQPGLHSPTLMTMQAIYTCQIILPTVRILREMLTFVIQCRDTEFKDLTAIEHLMRTYCLMHYFPELSPAYNEAQKIKSEIIKTLLAYTQPHQQEQETIHKSLWTQMISEVIKSIMTGPSTFIPGLQAFAELLPLPFPVPTLTPLTQAECQRLITERRLWSAHLHPISSQLTELIQTICPSSFPQLSDLLTRVCLQLADLAPNMTLLVSKTIVDLISTEFSTCSVTGTSTLARYLKFLAQLTSYASVKISSLSLFSGKLYEYFSQILCNTTEQSDAHLQCQQNIFRILENFFDSEISMIATNPNGNLELNLSCALPSKELIPGVTNTILTNILGSDMTKTVSTFALRALVILTEHDITFFHLRKALLSKKDQFQKWVLKALESHENSDSNQDVVPTLILLFRALVQIDESTTDSIIPNRTMKLTIPDLIELIGMKNENQNPFKKLKDFLEKQETKNDVLIQDINNFLELLESSMEAEDNSELIEPVLPQAEGIVTQYMSRPVYAIYETLEESQLTANYWLEPLRLDSFSEEVLSQLERIPCDLSEMATSCLPPETNLSSDCKRVLHLSASPQSNRDRTTTAPCFRTRRVEVEPSTGRPEKKIYVSPMRGRGFPRAPPSRGDLFRSRPPNTSRPPSLHVDDFLALETCGAQPTGPTGYNKLSRDIINIRGTRVGRGRGLRIATNPAYRTSSPATWTHVDPNAPPPPQHFRTATSEPVVTSHFGSDPIYAQPHFGGAPIRSRGRGRVRTFIR